jgi:hypothetical protein
MQEIDVSRVCSFVAGHFSNAQRCTAVFSKNIAEKRLSRARYLSVFMESLVFRVFSHSSPQESTVDSYLIFKLAGMTTVFSI